MAEQLTLLLGQTAERATLGIWLGLYQTPNLPQNGLKLSSAECMLAAQNQGWLAEDIPAPWGFIKSCSGCRRPNDEVSLSRLEGEVFLVCLPSFPGTTSVIFQTLSFFFSFICWLWLPWVSVAEHRLSLVAVSSGSSLAVVMRLSCSPACGIFLDQGSNPCPLRWQVASEPLDHQEGPSLIISCQCSCEGQFNGSCWFGFFSSHLSSAVQTGIAMACQPHTRPQVGYWLT